MKNLFDVATSSDVKTRLATLRVDSERHWGSMSPAQAVAHCCRSMEWAVGDTSPPRMFLGRIFGALVRPHLLKDDAPMRRNAPTTKDLIIRNNPDLDAERLRLVVLIDRFKVGGAAGCTTHPHPFFGKLTPEEWAILTYKHLDHHLRQFGA